MLDHGRIVEERDLAGLARMARESAGLSQTAAARRLRVDQATISHAENDPERNLTQLRLRMIAEFSGGYEVVPRFIVKRKTTPIRDGDTFL